MALGLPHTTKPSNQAPGQFGKAVSTRGLREGRHGHAAVCGGGVARCSFNIVDGAACVVDCCSSCCSVLLILTADAIGQ